MAREELVVASCSIEGCIYAPVAAVADGHKFRNSGRMFVTVTNTHPSALRALTFPTPGQIGGLDIEDPAVTIAAGKSVLIGRFQPLLFNQTSGDDIGMVYINYSNHTNLLIEVHSM